MRCAQIILPVSYITCDHVTTLLIRANTNTWFVIWARWSDDLSNHRLLLINGTIKPWCAQIISWVSRSMYLIHNSMEPYHQIHRKIESKVWYKCCHYTAAVLPQYCRGTAAVLPRYCRRTAAILPSEFWCMTRCWYGTLYSTPLSIYVHMSASWFI